MIIFMLNKLSYMSIALQFGRLVVFPNVHTITVKQLHLLTGDKYERKHIFELTHSCELNNVILMKSPCLLLFHVYKLSSNSVLSNSMEVLTI